MTTETGGQVGVSDRSDAGTATADPSGVPRLDRRARLVDVVRAGWRRAVVLRSDRDPSAFGTQLALLYAGSRLLFALGREVGGGRRPSNRLARTSRRYRSPADALAVVWLASVGTLLPFSAESTAALVAALTIQYGAYLLLVVYLMTVPAALVWTVRTDRQPVPIALLAVGVAVIAGISYRTMHPEELAS